MPKLFRITVTDGDSTVVGLYDIEISDENVARLRCRVEEVSKDAVLRNVERDIRLDLRDTVEDIAHDIAVTIRQEG